MFVGFDLLVLLVDGNRFRDTEGYFVADLLHFIAAAGGFLDGGGKYILGLSDCLGHLVVLDGLGHLFLSHCCWHRYL